jgi:hypothetical protein
LALAATASAHSIVYIKDGNVWLTSPDAAKQYQVTCDGGYASPSQADDGTIVALRAKQFVRMDRSGPPAERPDRRHRHVGRRNPSQAAESGARIDGD